MLVYLAHIKPHLFHLAGKLCYLLLYLAELLHLAAEEPGGYIGLLLQALWGQVYI